MNIVRIHSKLTFGTMIAITTILMITGGLVGGFTAQALTTHTIYHVGWEDGCADANSGSDTHHNFYVRDNYDSNDIYDPHSYYYMKHYNQGIADCMSHGPYDNIGTNHNTHNHNNGDNTISPTTTTTTNNQGQANTTSPTTTTTTTNNQGQANNQRVFCVVAVGTCNVISGQAQNINSK